MKRFRGRRISVGTLLGKLHRRENCPEKKVEVFIGLWVTVSLSISSPSRKPGFLAPTTDRLEAGGTRGQGELFTGSTVSEGQLRHHLHLQGTLCSLA